MFSKLMKVSGLLILANGLACGPPPRAGSGGALGAGPRPTPQQTVPGISEPSTAYRELGFLAGGRPVPFVGSVDFFATASPESTLVLLSVSLSNSALSFQRAGALFQGLYRVEAFFRADSGSHQIISDQAVRVGSFIETQRTDESIIFQQSIQLPPGDVSVTVVLRDRNSGGYSKDERRVRVPRFDGPSLSSIVPIYQGKPRPDRSAKPEFLANPRATIPYGSDSVRLYLEGYGVRSDSFTLRAVDEGGNEVWRSAPGLSGDSAMRAGFVRLPSATFPIGRIRLEAVTAGGKDTTRTPLLVSFSDQWVVANFEGVLNLLRYFGEEDAIRAMRTAPDSTRSELWRKFWRATDPNPATPENEALMQYFSRLQTANTRYREGNDAPGWLTDRGEVFVTLGEPDQVFDQSTDLQGQRRFIRWTYNSDRLILDFVDESGFGRFRLNASSRADFQRAAARVRRHE
jgi:GWxTD domain-containing protein